VDVEVHEGIDQDHHVERVVLVAAAQVAVLAQASGGKGPRLGHGLREEPVAMQGLDMVCVEV
jgi:hypothetical protein